ncbi:hypothetical protein [Sphingobacterium corticibacterium]|uniref:O-antigen ligase domain-containing protein n=1 Tax=Sphingobacterium corticibacterium TaxID=2484746 RepID=A0A4Q6XIB4_9SPHI|nr:hypothetical protein [Sphingobacterium corticibacterium]RZF58945.1 hypothetical protein EWE74_16635 [Sphingobacterium corticibacterium]
MNHAILWLTVIFCFCYLLQYIIYPTVLFRGAQEDFSHDVRIRLAGQGIVSLGFFLSLNRLLVTDRLKLKYLAIMSACVGVMILMGFRTVLLALLIISFVMVITIKGFNFRLTLYLLGFLIIGGFFSQMPFVQDKIQAMQERQETDNMSNDNYIRVLQLEYYLNEHFKDSKEFVFGSGIPALNDNGNYSKYMNILLDSGLTWVDFGLFSISWLIGIPTVLMMIWYSIMCVSKRVSVNNRFLGFWFLFLLLISFTTAEFFRSGNFVIQSVVFYYIELANKSYLFSMYEKRSKGRYTYIPSGT